MKPEITESLYLRVNVIGALACFIVFKHTEGTAAFVLTSLLAGLFAVEIVAAFVQEFRKHMGK